MFNLFATAVRERNRAKNVHIMREQSLVFEIMFYV